MAVEHPHLHRHVEVCVVIDLHDALACVEAVKTTDVLRDGAAPRGGHGEEKCIQPRVVESLAEETPGGDDDAWLAAQRCLRHSSLGVIKSGTEVKRQYWNPNTHPKESLSVGRGEIGRAHV